MKAIILTPVDLERLLAMLDRDPSYGFAGGSMKMTADDPESRRIYDDAHRFYNYQVRHWIEEVSR